MMAVSMAGRFGEGDVMVNFPKIGHGHRFFLIPSCASQLGLQTMIYGGLLDGTARITCGL